MITDIFYLADMFPLNFSSFANSNLPVVERARDLSRLKGEST